MGRTSGRPNLGRLAEGELAAFSKHSFVVATLLHIIIKILFFFSRLKKMRFREKKRKINNFYHAKQSAHNSKYYRRCFLYSKFKKKWEQSLLVAMKKRH